MSGEVSFRVLGPLRVTVGGRDVPIRGSRQRSLLAALLVHAGKPVPLDHLVQLVWSEESPARPRSALHTALTRLRQCLDGGGAGLAGLLRTSESGYRVEVPPGRLDLTAFRELVGRARTVGTAGDPGAERRCLSDALGLWQGRPLTGITSEELQRDVVPGLMEEWLTASGRYHEVSLALGFHDEIIGDLRALTSRYPFHEGFWQQLMLALYHCGRRGEALETYTEVSGLFRDELGVEPGHGLRRLHLAMLRADEFPTPVSTA